MKRTEPRFRQNFHTHTFRCQHASGDVADYCRVAQAEGLTTLGMSDHTPLPDNRWPKIRMRMDELPDYCAAIDQAQQDFPELTVLKGMECEYDDEYHAFYQETLLDELQFDYLVGAAHFVPDNGDWISCYRAESEVRLLKNYVSHFIKTMESGLYAFMAHPDLFGVFYLDWDENVVSASKDLFAAAADLKMPLEINAYGMRKPVIVRSNGTEYMYPVPDFWEIGTDYNIEVLVNSDAHRPQDMSGKVPEAYDLVDRLDLQLAQLDFSPPEKLKKAS